MDVGSAALDRVQQHLVHEANDGRILDVIPVFFLASLFLPADIEILEVEVIVGEPRHAGVDGLDRFADAVVELVLLDDHRVDAEARGEANVIDCLKIGRVRNTQEHPLAALDERQHAVLGDQVLVDRANHVDVNVDRVEVEQRYAEFV